MTLGSNDYKCLGYGFPCGQCTSFGFWRIRNDLGWPNFTPNYGGATFADADTWLAAAKQAGIPTDTTANRGSVAVLPAETDGAGAAGHVAVVLARAQNGELWVEDYNWFDNGTYSQHAIGTEGVGFIHFLKTPPPTTEDDDVILVRNSDNGNIYRLGDNGMRHIDGQEYAIYAQAGVQGATVVTVETNTGGIAGIPITGQ